MALYATFRAMSAAYKADDKKVKVIPYRKEDLWLLDRGTVRIQFPEGNIDDVSVKQLTNLHIAP